MRIAIASSGLGHVARGIETWASETAEALATRGIDVCLFAGGSVTEGQRDRVTKESGGRTPEVGSRRHARRSLGVGGSEVSVSDQTLPQRDRVTGEQGRGRVMGVNGEVDGGCVGSVPCIVIPCWQRGRWAARTAARVTPGYAWRWGLKSTYGWEQLTFWWHLRKRLVDGGFDILHVQDPMLAFWCRRARLAGRVATQEILAHGTEEPPEFLAQFECVQHLAPWHLETTLQSLQSLQRGHSLQEEHGNRRLQTRLRQGLHLCQGFGAHVGGHASDPPSPRLRRACHRPQTSDLDVSAEQLRPFRLSGFPARLLHPRPPTRLRQGYGGHASDLRPAYAKASAFAKAPAHVPAGMPPTSDLWISIPNFVDTNEFRPVQDDAERTDLRRRFGIPVDAFVIGTAAAIKRHHKRIDYLIREFSSYASHVKAASSVAAGGTPELVEGPCRWASTPAAQVGPSSPHLVIAGARQSDTDSLKALADELAPGRVTFLVNVPHENMSDLLRCYDVFVLTSLFEMMPIALLEAIATGLPVITNDHPVLSWMGGEGGVRIDMGTEDGLATALEGLTASEIVRMSRAARDRAVSVFSEDVAIGDYIDYYHRICADGGAVLLSDIVSPLDEP